MGAKRRAVDSPAFLSSFFLSFFLSLSLSLSWARAREVFSSFHPPRSPTYLPSNSRTDLYYKERTRTARGASAAGSPFNSRYYGNTGRHVPLVGQSSVTGPVGARMNGVGKNKTKATNLFPPIVTKFKCTRSRLFTRHFAANGSGFIGLTDCER